MSRIVLVTGASRGIGKAICERFKNAGDTILGCGSKPESLKTIEADHAFVCDVARVTDVKAAYKKIAEKYGRIDILVNNAGLAGANSLDACLDDDVWQRILDVNLNGTYFMSKYGLPYVPEKTGRIVNIASILALKGVPESTAYCAAKHGVLGFTRALAHTLAPKGITVNAICPGWTRTEMATDRMDELGLKESDFKTSVPLGRFIEPHEIADMVFYLASAAAGGITGQSISVDGGVYP